MNSLMTKSFLNYVELKKQAKKDSEPGHESDIESGFCPLTNAEQNNLSIFFSDVEPIQSEITSIAALLSDLTRLSSESETTRTRNLLRGLRDQMDSDIEAILRKAQIIRARLASLDSSNATNRVTFGSNSPVDRTRSAVTNGLRSKLRGVMNGFNSLRESITVFAEQPKEKVMNGSETGQVVVEVVESEVEERDRAVSELKRSLSRLHQVFLDMAVVVEVQEEQLNDIEENVVRAKEYISGGTGRLVEAEALRRRRGSWWLVCWGCLLVVVIVILICLVSRYAD